MDIFQIDRLTTCGDRRDRADRVLRIRYPSRSIKKVTARVTTDSFIQFIPDESAMLDFGAQLAQSCPDTAIIFLYGNLGAGKTTFSRGFLRGLGYPSAVKSPTYTIVEPYQFEHFMLYHFDFYRIRDAQELEYIGIQDYFGPKTICLIEWPDYGAGLLPPADLSCYIEPHNSGREVKIIAHSVIGQNILKRLRDEK